MKLRYSIFYEVEIDFETKQSRILRHYINPIGEGSKLKKAEPVQAKLGKMNIEEG